jgi:rhodanese-related sulfurtransferase
MKSAPKFLVIAIAVMALPALMNAQCGSKSMSTSVMDKADTFVKSVPENMMYLLSADKLAGMIESGKTDFVVLDVRPPKYYEAGHIKGAMNIPLTMLVAKMDKIPRDKKVAVVCTMDTNSAFAVAVLQMHGYDAWIVEGGIPGWENSGRPLVK